MEFPTTYPPTSKWEGISSWSHAFTIVWSWGGGRRASCGAWVIVFWRLDEPLLSSLEWESTMVVGLCVCSLLWALILRG